MATKHVRDVKATRTELAFARLIRGVFVFQYQAAKHRLEGVESTWGNRFMATWDGPSVNQPSIWIRAAKICIANGFDPTLFVTAQFVNASLPPRPNVLSGLAATQKYALYTKTAATRIRDRWALQETHLATRAGYLRISEGLSAAASVRAAVLDPSTSLSPLFRYCKAVDAGDKLVASEFRGQALFQYVINRKLYDEFLGSRIPKRLRNAASALHEEEAGDSR